MRAAKRSASCRASLGQGVALVERICAAAVPIARSSARSASPQLRTTARLERECLRTFANVRERLPPEWNCSAKNRQRFHRDHSVEAFRKWRVSPIAQSEFAGLRFAEPQGFRGK